MMTALAWVLGAAAVMTGLYGLHRLALHLEQKGLLYYKHKQPESGSAGSMFVPLHQFAEPQVRHVMEVKEQRRVATSDDPGDPPD